MFSRLQKLRLCTSQQTSINSQDKLGKNFDSKVMQWKSHLVERTVDRSHIQVRLLAYNYYCDCYHNYFIYLYRVQMSPLRVAWYRVHSWRMSVILKNLIHYIQMTTLWHSHLSKYQLNRESSFQCTSHPLHLLSYPLVNLQFLVLSARMILHDLMWVTTVSLYPFLHQQKKQTVPFNKFWHQENML